MLRYNMTVSHGGEIHDSKCPLSATTISELDCTGSHSLPSRLAMKQHATNGDETDSRLCGREDRVRAARPWPLCTSLLFEMRGNRGTHVALGIKAPRKLSSSRFIWAQKPYLPSVCSCDRLERQVMKERIRALYPRDGICRSGDCCSMASHLQLLEALVRGAGTSTCQTALRRQV